jgi:hypothetical protein
LWLLLAFSLALLTAPVGAVAIASGPVTFLIPPESWFNGGFTPKALSQTAQTPIVLSLSMRVVPAKAARPPALQEFTLELDRHIGTALRRFPTCLLGIQEQPQARQRCRAARIGEGMIDTSIAFPESQEVHLTGRLEIFNGAEQAGFRRLWGVAHLPAPISGDLLLRGELRKRAGERSGRYGSAVSFAVPQIADGSGSITGFQFELGRASRNGRRLGVFTATCRGGVIYLHAEGLLADGSHVIGELPRTCTRRR